MTKNLHLRSYSYLETQPMINRMMGKFNMESVRLNRINLETYRTSWRGLHSNYMGEKLEKPAENYDLNFRTGQYEEYD